MTDVPAALTNALEIGAILVLISVAASLLGEMLQRVSSTLLVRTRSGEVRIDLNDTEMALSVLRKHLRSPQVFLAHATADRETAKVLACKLRQTGFKVWLDDEEIRPGDSIPARIEDGLAESDIFLALLSTAAGQAEWTMQEFSLALDRERRNGAPRVIPVLIGDVELPERLRTKKALRIDDGVEETVRQIAAVANLDTDERSGSAARRATSTASVSAIE